MGQYEIRGRDRSDQTTSQEEPRVVGKHKMGEARKDSSQDPS